MTMPRTTIAEEEVCIAELRKSLCDGQYTTNDGHSVQVAGWSAPVATVSGCMPGFYTASWEAIAEAKDRGGIIMCTDLVPARRA
jgi:hypothetical protein